MIRAMDLTVTVRAAPVEEEVGIWPIPQSVSAVVTLVAESRYTYFEQPIIDGTVRFVAIVTIFEDRRMLKEERASPLGMALVASLVHACLYELRGIGRAVRVVAIGAAYFSFSHRHMRRTHELGFSLQVALAAHLNRGPFVEKRSFVIQLRQLVPVGRFLHHGVTIDAGEAPTGMGAGFPVGLYSLLVALETRLVLNFGGLSGIFAEIDKPADASSPSRGHVIASRTVARFARLLLAQSAGVEEKNLAHHRLGEFFKLRGVAGLADFAADKDRFLAGSGSFSGPGRSANGQEEG
jgi:hypothetical protein